MDIKLQTMFNIYRRLQKNFCQAVGVILRQPRWSASSGQDVAEDGGWSLGPTSEPSQSGAAQVSPLCAEQEPDCHGQQQGAVGGDNQVHRRDPHLGRSE